MQLIFYYFCMSEKQKTPQKERCIEKMCIFAASEGRNPRSQGCVSCFVLCIKFAKFSRGIESMQRSSVYISVSRIAHAVRC